MERATLFRRWCATGGGPGWKPGWPPLPPLAGRSLHSDPCQSRFLALEVDRFMGEVNNRVRAKLSLPGFGQGLSRGRSRRQHGDLPASVFLFAGDKRDDVAAERSVLDTVTGGATQGEAECADATS